MSCKQYDRLHHIRLEAGVRGLEMVGLPLTLRLLPELRFVLMYWHWRRGWSTHCTIEQPHVGRHGCARPRDEQLQCKAILSVADHAHGENHLFTKAPASRRCIVSRGDGVFPRRLPGNLQEISLMRHFDTFHPFQQRLLPPITRRERRI